MKNNIVPKISVIIPIYNMEKYLRECLDSVINQTLKDIEIICINDGSTDNSESIIREYAAKNDKIKLFNQTNQGVARARNKGINEAHGEYVVFMDPDDYYPNNETLELLYTNVKKHNVLICGGSFSCDKGGGIQTEFQGVQSKYQFKENRLITYKEYQFDYGYQRFIYNLDMLKANNIYYPEYIRFQDPPFFVKAMITAKEFYALKEPTYRYRFGYQKINWDEKRTTALLKGLIDNLKMSNEYGLEELHRLTVYRVFNDYLHRIMINLPNEKVLALLFKLNGLINKDYVRLDDSLSETIMPIFLKFFKENGLNPKANSASFFSDDVRAVKVGKAILYIPRKIKRVAKRILKGRKSKKI